MRLVKRIILGLLLTLVLLVAGGWLWLLTSLPKTDGLRAINGLQKTVEIRRDRYGVPHIKARTEHDSYVALGYVHAQDRLWQMDFLRRLGAGRLSEILGDSTVRSDRYMRTLGLYRLALRLAGMTNLLVLNLIVLKGTHSRSTPVSFGRFSASVRHGAGDCGQKRFGEILQFGGADAVDRGEILDGLRGALRHMDKRPVGKDDIGGHAALLGELQPNIFQDTEQHHLFIGQGLVGHRGAQFPRCSRHLGDRVRAVEKSAVATQQRTATRVDSEPAITRDIDPQQAGGDHLADQ